MLKTNLLLFFLFGNISQWTGFTVFLLLFLFFHYKAKTFKTVLNISNISMLNPFYFNRLLYSNIYITLPVIVILSHKPVKYNFYCCFVTIYNSHDIIYVCLFKLFTFLFIPFYILLVTANFVYILTYIFIIPLLFLTCCFILLTQPCICTYVCT